MKSLQEYKGFEYNYVPMQESVRIARHNREAYEPATLNNFKEVAKNWIDGFLADEAIKEQYDFENEMLLENDEI